MIRRPPRSTQSRSSAASDVYKRQGASQRGGAPVWVVQAPVKRRCPGSGPPGQARHLIGPQSAWRPLPGSAFGVPRIECGGGSRESGEGRPRIAQIGVVARGPVEMLAGKGQAQVPRVAAGVLPGSPWHARLARVGRGVKDSAAELGIMSPGAPVEVARADRRPHVVDDEGLGVDVYRRAVVVLDPVDGYPVTAASVQNLERQVVPDNIGRQRQPPVLIWVAGNDRDQVQPGVRGQGFGDRGRHLRRPEVLVLEIDQGSGPAEHLGVAARDAALGIGGEEVASPPVRVLSLIHISEPTRLGISYAVFCLKKKKKNKKQRISYITQNQKQKQIKKQKKHKN